MTKASLSVSWWNQWKLPIIMEAGGDVKNIQGYKLSRTNLPSVAHQLRKGQYHLQIIPGSREVPGRGPAVFSPRQQHVHCIMHHIGFIGKDQLVPGARNNCLPSAMHLSMLVWLWVQRAPNVRVKTQREEFTAVSMRGSMPSIPVLHSQSAANVYAGARVKPELDAQRLDFSCLNTQVQRGSSLATKGSMWSGLFTVLLIQEHVGPPAEIRALPVGLVLYTHRNRQSLPLTPSQKAPQVGRDGRKRVNRRSLLHR